MSTDPLATLITEYTDEPMWSAVVIAKRILASDWLAAHDAQVRADERQKVEAEVRELRAERDAVIEAVRAIHSQDESVLAAGAWCPVDGDEAPCRTLRAMHDVLAGLIGGDE